MTIQAQTPIYSFPQNSEFSGIVVKREDLSETGSHKFRYLEKQLQELKEEGADMVVLSTTGNAGISAAYYGKKLGMKVICLMSDKGDMNKAAEIEKNGANLIVTPRPIRFSKYIAKKFQVPLLRSSKDEVALAGYKSLGEEIIEQVPDADAIINFCTSGTSSLGLMKAYEERELKLPALHLVQSGKSNSLAKALHPEQVPDSFSETQVGLTDTARKDDLLNLIKKSGGDAWYISRSARKFQDPISKFQFDTSEEGLSCFEVATRIKDRYQQIVVVFSGKKWPSADFIPKISAESFTDIDQLIKSLI